MAFKMAIYMPRMSWNINEPHRNQSLQIQSPEKLKVVSPFVDALVESLPSWPAWLHWYVEQPITTFCCLWEAPSTNVHLQRVATSASSAANLKNKCNLNASTWNLFYSIISKYFIYGLNLLIRSRVVWIEQFPRIEATLLRRIRQRVGLHAVKLVKGACSIR